jgi:hypothetical protein
MYQYNDRLTQLFTSLESVVHALHFLRSLYRPDDDPDKGRNIVAKAKYIYTCKELC